MKDLVEVHSGYTYGERPLAFHWEGRRLEVKTVLASWRTPQGAHFRIRTTDDRDFELAYQEVADEWQIQPL